MADYTLTTTGQQDALLTWVVQQHNAERGTNLTNEQFLNETFPTLLAPYLDRFKAAQNVQLGKAYEDASPQAQRQIRMILGLV